MEPLTPHPGQLILNEMLTRWTTRPRAQEIPTQKYSLNGTISEPLQQNLAEKAPKLLEANGLGQASLAVAPMLQREVKAYLIYRHNADEAAIIGYLVREIAGHSIASRYSGLWDWADK